MRAAGQGRKPARAKPGPFQAFRLTDEGIPADRHGTWDRRHSRSCHRFRKSHTGVSPLSAFNNAQYDNTDRILVAQSIAIFHLTGTAGSWSLWPMLRYLLWLSLLIIPLAVLPHEAPRAQPKSAPSPASIPPGTPPPATIQPGAISPDQARAALDVLNDPKKRAAFSATLEALIKSQTAAEPAPPSPAIPPETPAAAPAKPDDQPPAIHLAPNSLGAQVLLSASAFLNNVAEEVPRALNAMQSIPLLWGWLFVMVTNPLGQQLLMDVSWRLAATLAVAMAAAVSLHMLLRRPMARLLALGAHGTPTGGIQPDDDPQARAERGDIEPPPRRRGFPGFGRRLGLGLVRFALQMVPVLGLLIAGHSVAASNVGGPPNSDSRLIILAVLDAIALSRTLLELLTLLFEPDPPGLRLLPISPSVGAYLVRWGRRLVLIAVPGYTIGEVGWLLGLSAPAHDALQKAVGLALAICLGIIVVQRRRTVRRWLSAPPDRTGAVAQLRNLVARTWHWGALFFLAATWLGWTVGAPDAIARALWYCGVTVAVIAAATLTRTAIVSLLDAARPQTQAAPASTRSQTILARLGVYHPALRELAQWLINVLAVLGLLQLYGLGILSWLLTSDVGHRVVSGCATLIVTICLAFAVWEGANIGIESHLDRMRQGAQTARLARLRTLLPLIRTTLAITVLVVAGLMVLSEVGVNIAPLLAGAGIVGVAIGFGSQKLVQDVITGVFLLLENTMQVGDVVKVSDQSGVVESLSVRTIRLRTEDGSVVVMPFSAVTTVINMTRDYSRAVITINVSVEEDVDRVTDAMRAILREMRAEEAWNSVILDDLEVWGVDRFTDTAVQIKCRVMCTPFGRWSVGREYNRRLKARFEVVGVASAFSAMKLSPPPDVKKPDGGGSAGAEAVVERSQEPVMPA
jgi:small-conductance mechanosensitive channel